MPRTTKFELSLFEDLLSADLEPSVIENTLKNRDLAELKTLISDETRRIINEFRAVTFSNCQECHFVRYIQYHQKETMKLMNGLYGCMELLVQSRNGDVLYHLLMDALDRILNYLKTDHSKYFDLDLLVPDSYRSASAKELNAELLVLTAKLRSKETDPELQALILDYISRHCSKPSCTYRQQLYIRLLMKNLLKLLSVNKEADWNGLIVTELMYLNFNTNRFFIYCRMQVAVLVDAEPTFAKQSARFSRCIKEVKQQQVKFNVACKTGRPSIAKLLLNYMCMELIYLNKLQKGERRKQPVQDLKERAKNYDFKLPVNVNVKQLALFLELFIRVEIFIIAKGEIMTTMKFFADNLTTIGTDEISAANLNNSRKPNPQTIAWTIETLERMLSVVKDMGV